MTSVAKGSDSGNRPLAEAEGAAILQRYEELWNRGALSELIDGFTHDITVDFADLPTINGKTELEAVIRARLVRQKNYRLKKQLRAVVDRTIIGTWTADWTDGTTGQAMKGKGIEFIEMRDGKCARWEATFNAWSAEGPRKSFFT